MKIAFTSCTRYEAFENQPEWQDISDQNPDYLFLLGDNIYMDYGLPFFSSEPIGAPEDYSTDKFRNLMKSKYENQFKRVPEFKELVASMRQKNGFFAIWDDHDFAWDNAKGTKVCSEKEKISRALFHEYTKCSTNMPHVYYHIDTPLARVIFLDNRTDAEEKGVSSKILSDTQFEFIENKMNHDLPYTIICGGLTLTKGSENWTNYPSQLKRLCNILETKEKVMFLGGDIHTNKFVKPKKLENLGVTTPVQLISSGMQINFLGLGIPQDDQHNWAMLEIEENKVEVTYYNKHGRQKRLTKKANKWMRENLS